VWAQLLSVINFILKVNSVSAVVAIVIGERIKSYCVSYQGIMLVLHL
jgi:hypothetical protein